MLPDGGVRCPMLEPYEAKVSCTVLRGREASNGLLLPDRLPTRQFTEIIND